MSALFRAAAAVLVSCALGAGAVYGGRALESGHGADRAMAAPAELVAFTQGRGARTARLDAVAQACGDAFVLRQGGVAGVEHVIVFATEPREAGARGDASLQVRRLSAPGDVIGAQAGRGGLRLTSAGGFEGLAWRLSGGAAAQALGPIEADALTLPCADPATAAARFNTAPGAAETALR